MQRIPLWFLFFINSAASLGQGFDSTLYLHPVEISAYRYQNFSFANHIEKIDSLVLSNAVSKNLSQLLNEQSSLFVKSYGSQSATFSCRGTGTAHNLITWNGIPLNNPMLGLSDISLVPIQFFNYATITAGNNCTLEGSGAAGSTIDVGMQPQFNSGTDFSATKTIGSYGLSYTGFGIASHSDKFYISTQAFHQKSVNNFPFINTTQLHSPGQELSNNALLNYGINSAFFYKINSKQIVSVQGWFQNDEREIPPTLLQSQSLAHQKDFLKRVSVSWEKEAAQFTWNVKSAWCDEVLDYRDPMTGLISIGNFTNWISLSELHLKLNNGFYFSTGINNTYTTAFTNEYHETKTRNTLSIYAASSYQNKGDWLHIGITGRENLQDLKNNPLTGSLSLEEKISNTLSFTQMIASLYRIPTLNDLFWVPGGDRNLDPESGWNADAGIRFSKSLDRYKISISNTIFSYFFNDLIVWQPGKGGYWSPRNVNSVWSRGNELEGKLNYKIHRTDFQFRLAACYTLATNETENNAALHKQLPYTPEFVFRSSVTINYNDWNLCYSHSFTSLTYVTSDNKESLPDYDLPGLHLSKKIYINGSNKFCQAGIDIYNLLNTSYQVIAYRPMPGRNFEFTFKLTL